tara:strand:- start:5037 stop:5708 length:672 start_codon:yes stop_codon:yes gene_type:complete
MSKTQTIKKTTGVCIGKDKVISEIKIPENLNIDRLDFNKIKSFKISKGCVYERECDFQWNDKTISIYASSNGKAGNENQYDLPPPIDSQLYFGNVLALCHEDSKLTKLSHADFNQFYDDAMGGFESLGDEDSYSDEEEPDSDDSIHEFIVNDSEIEEESEDSENEQSCHSSDSVEESEEEPELMSTGESIQADNSEEDESEQHNEISNNEEQEGDKSDDNEEK